MDARAGVLRAEDAVRGAHESLAAMEATYAFWMTQYERQTRDVAAWVDAHAAEEAGADETAPRFQLLLRALEPTQHGLDCAAQSLAQAQHRLVSAQEELQHARQFFLEESKARDAAVEFNSAVALDAARRTAGIAPPGSESSAQVTPAILPVAPATSSIANLVSPAAAKSGSMQTQAASVAGLGGATGQSARVPSTRAHYPQKFPWTSDGDLHRFPEDFDMPRCTLAEAWQAWCCGGSDGAYPPLRVLEAQDLPTRRVRNRYSDLRMMMKWIEGKVRARGAWPDDDIVDSDAAAAMFDQVKGGIGTSRSQRERQMQPVENLMWTTAANIVRKHKLEDEEAMKQASNGVSDSAGPATDSAATTASRQAKKSARFSQGMSDIDQSGGVDHVIDVQLQSPAAKRQRKDSSPSQLPPTTRVRCPRNFLWARDGTMHHFPEDFQVPNIPLPDIWKLWCCGDEARKVLPLRVLMARDLTLSRSKASFANFRRVMLWVEGLVRAKGIWEGEVRPTTERAGEMFAGVKEDIVRLRSAHTKHSKPLERTKWSTFERLLHLERTKKE